MFASSTNPRSATIVQTARRAALKSATTSSGSTPRVASKGVQGGGGQAQRSDFSILINGCRDKPPDRVAVPRHCDRLSRGDEVR